MSVRVLLIEKYSKTLVTWNTADGKPWVPRFLTLNTEPARGCAFISSVDNLKLVD